MVTEQQIKEREKLFHTVHEIVDWLDSPHYHHDKEHYKIDMKIEHIGVPEHFKEFVDDGGILDLTELCHAIHYYMQEVRLRILDKIVREK
jgi:hypothetical protein